MSQLKEFVENNMRLQKEKYGGVGFASKELSEKAIATALRNNNLESKEDLNKLIMKIIFISQFFLLSVPKESTT